MRQRVVSSELARHMLALRLQRHTFMSAVYKANTVAVLDKGNPGDGLFEPLGGPFLRCDMLQLHLLLLTRPRGVLQVHLG